MKKNLAEFCFVGSDWDTSDVECVFLDRNRLGNNIEFLTNSCGRGGMGVRGSFCSKLFVQKLEKAPKEVF